MEDRGVIIDKPKAQKLINKLKVDTENTLQELENVIGRRIKPGTDEFRDYIFNELKMPVLARTKTGLPKFGKDELAALRELSGENPHPILELTAKYKSWSRGVTIISSYLTKADDEGAIHPHIRTCAAITGRESCTNPNLYNVEKEGVLLNPYPVPARTIFRPRPGFVNFHLDYAGQEMRVLVDATGDELLLQIANEGHPEYGHDLHLPATLIFYGDKFRNASKEDKKQLRNASKNGNFAIAYGAQFLKVAKALGLSGSAALSAWQTYKITFPRLTNFMPVMMKQVREHGYIQTPFGRRIHMPRGHAYMGPNYYAQGTGAEMIKRAQCKIAPILEKETGNEVRLLMQIYDEIILECPRSRLSDARHILRDKVVPAMTNFGNRFKVPFEVEVKVATVDWQHKSPFELK